MYYLHFAQSAYGSDNYGTSLYGGDTTTQTQNNGGLTDTGNPVLWGGIVGASLIIATILMAIATARKRKNQK